MHACISGMQSVLWTERVLPARDNLTCARGQQLHGFRDMIWGARVPPPGIRHAVRHCSGC